MASHTTLSLLTSYLTTHTIAVPYSVFISDRMTAFAHMVMMDNKNLEPSVSAKSQHLVAVTHI